MQATTAKGIQNVYLFLLLSSTLAASFIWGINTIFLLDAGLNNLEAFAANAFFTAGQVIFEVPTGIIADRFGRRISYLLGSLTLMISTLLYLYLWYISAPFWMWAFASVLLGLGFTFFSGATEAWLVDALHFTKYKGTLEQVFAKGQVIGGIAMLVGSIGGGIIAQTTSLSVPYILRAIILGLTFIVAFFFMRDLGFTPRKSRHPLRDIQGIFGDSLKYGLKNPSVRWLMIAAVFTTGLSFYVFYALQPYLLELYGDEKAYGIAGLVAAIVAGAQIAGGLGAQYIKKFFRKKTSVLLLCTFVTAILLLLIGLFQNFVVALILIFIWGLLSAAMTPIRQSYIHGLIPSEQRATIISFDSLMGSSGGIFIQPILGRVADVGGYASSFMYGVIFQLLALPFLFLSRREKEKTDIIT